jgi:ribosomal protein S18 acetylase RimI-like enzyme
MTSAAITLREATENDLPAILDLYQATGIGDADNFTVDEARVHFDKLRQYPSLRVFVAVLNQDPNQDVDQPIIGTYELLLMDKLAKRGKPSGIVEDVAVHPLHQGSGVGRAMMQHALELCRQAGRYKLTLSSNLRREAAHRFYDSLGFERHGYSFRTDIP